jgi:hypothetical protein
MITTLDDGNGRAIRFENQSMLAVDSPRPIAGPIILERLQIANAFEGMTFDILNRDVDAFEYLFISGLPIQIIVPGIRRPS